MSIDASHWATILFHAEERAKKKYPKQPERARQMIDSELGMTNGPYDFESLSLWQRLQVLFNKNAHERNPDWVLHEPLNTPYWRLKWNRFTNLAFRGKY